MIRQSELLTGPADMLVLRVLGRARLHPWGITQRLQQLSHDVVQLDDSSLAASLRRMRERGWVDLAPRSEANGDPVPTYRLTRLGRRQFKRFVAEYERISVAIAHVMKGA